VGVKGKKQGNTPREGSISWKKRGNPNFGSLWKKTQCSVREKDLRGGALKCAETKGKN